jgi:UV DNA damage repair endonuclease
MMTSELLAHISYSQAVQKKTVREQWSNDVEKFLADGGKVRTLDRSQYQTFRSPCFNKSLKELQKMAIKNKRKTFSYWCDKHGIGQFKSKDGTCIRCGVKT